ncbi:hypothetical protein C0993_007719 [Termitomyces sp. T159_Od127]|nr:hypothetical protein C0993_007719 [Termitomyces sp. T159_Od127]
MLQTDLILGLQFLEKNALCVDSEKKSLVDKKTEFDLLNSSWIKFSPRPQVEGPVERRRQEKKEVKAEQRWIKEGQQGTTILREPVLFELNALFAKKKCEMERYTTEDDAWVIGMVKARIESLAMAKRLKRLDLKMKQRFEFQFPHNIPHADELPNNVYHRIQVKPLAKITVARSYSCPQKYRDG